MSQKAFKTGNSLAVTIPSGFVSSVGVKPGDSVRVREERDKARVVYQFSGTHQLPLDEVIFSRKKK